MKFENTRVTNFEGAFRGLRNPMNSWAKSDSQFGITAIDWLNDKIDETVHEWCAVHGNDTPLERLQWLEKNSVLAYDAQTETYEYALIGPTDMDLAQRMIKAGSPNDKFLRQIFVSVDITAPLFWWKEADTYKVGTVANSTSTMHKLASTPITLECFEIDDYQPDLVTAEAGPESTEAWVDTVGDKITESIIPWLEHLRLLYLETKDKRYWKELIRWLPEGWLQTRTLTMNYANLRGMYYWRKDHKLSEWHSFCDWVKTLPYAEELITFNN